MWIRLRQIALVAHDLESVVGDFHSKLGLEVAFRDPGVASFGLTNAVMAAGQQFIEVVSPFREATTGGRYLERRGGDGGYMVILQIEDHAAVKARIEALGIRKVVEQDGREYKIMQLHPKDTGGSFLEIDVQIGGESMDGPWEPAGPNWQAARTDVVVAITAAEIQSDDPTALAARWSAILGRPIVTDGAGRATIELDNAALRFVAIEDGRGEGLGGIDVAVTAGSAATTGSQSIGGLRVRVV